MKSDWILDVLADLKNFATANGLPLLADQLEIASIVAITEIAEVVGHGVCISSDVQKVL